ncbi:MAG: putative minor capsid protein [Oscillospiraceae bacterium]|nr:putative minor capsid protein [Oscillospiraceae bacterium]
MNLSQPIPRALLPHTITLKTPMKSGIFADGDYEEITLFNVRFERDEKARQTKSGDVRSKGARFYFDCVNSSADGDFGIDKLQFNTNQTVTFCGETYKIDGVKSVMAGDKIHHYKVEVI